MNLLYAEFIPALLSFIMTVIWFCVTIVMMSEETHPIMVWAARLAAIFLAFFVFMIHPVAAWFVFSAQVLLSIALLLSDHAHAPRAYQRVHSHVRKPHMADFEPLKERAVGK